MEENYRAWEIDFSQFAKCISLEEQLAFLLRFAVLAPSTHNTQPWKFHIHKNAITLSVDPQRTLPACDANQRLLSISLGCALMNLLVAADYYHFHTEVEYFPNLRNEYEVTSIAFHKKPVEEKHENHLIFSLPHRHTNRHPYLPKLPPQSFLERIKTLENDEIKINIVWEEEKRTALADIALRSFVATGDDRNFRNEFASYLKSNITASKIGMPGFCLNLPLPVSFLAPRIFRRLNVQRIVKKQQEAILYNRTPAFGIITARDDEKTTWVKIGELYQKISLEAVREGMATTPWTSVIQTGNFYREVAQALPTDFRPQFFFRLGYPVKEARPTPRLLPQEVTSVSAHELL